MDCFVSYERFVDKFNDENLLSQYKVLYRQWNEIKYEHIILENIVKKPNNRNGNIEWEDCGFTIKDLIEWNAGYFNKSKLSKDIFAEKNEKGYYTDLIDENKSILDIFFLGEQPLLNIKYFEPQTRASKMLNDAAKPNFHLVFDEVGTGKTVAALYCVRDVVAQKHEKSRILIICPNNKKSEWQKDVKRQLGLYAHIADNGNSKYVYEGDIKKVYFKNNEPTIFIEGQKGNEKNSGLDKWKETDEKWDLIIIDEGHQCFENYNTLKGDKVLLLTATPIVVNSNTKDEELQISNVRTLNEYIEKLNYIIGVKNDYSLENLFSDSDMFTQLFREDLKIEPKTRNIAFEKCNRWQEREKYLDVLSDVKGGMTRLIYEQDDELLIYGVFNKFRKDIEGQGYIVDNKTPKIENDKYKTLINYISKNESKSYIIFFNTKWPADNIYKKLVDDINLDKRNVIIAKKYGGKLCEVWPQDNSVTAKNIFDYLQGQIAAGKRVIFLTTGASGGTGLNLGKFDGVINYELPFTSIELEQRFGRVDRMDAADTTNKEMFFILNRDANPMLRYSTLKINKTCEYMPIRNTVLFCSDFIDANIESLKIELERCYLSEEKQKLLTDFCKFQNSIDDKDKQLIEKLVKYIMKAGKIDGFTEDIAEISEETQSFIDMLISNTSEIIKFYHIKRTLNYLENEILHWCNLIGQRKEDISIDSNSVLVVDDEADYEEYEQKENLIKSGSIAIKGTKAQKDVEFLIDIRIVDKFGELKQKLEGIKDSSNHQVATGLFYIKDNQYCRQTVKEYRNTFKGGKLNG
ncbi:DEAD/DEAH box helicase family protein [Clostridium botulinum C]|uniref:DEAD/DEAH box helicase n=2 Tax=Clostridium botulinum TaxID=1491 RepID=A0A9Q4TEP8_CLOBO|nr:DEAD/DEAH box helicase [Clostridium botulinum]MCD3193922.1 DEAD/DEAH box helicase family protein [Clostridium botulinum C]MCD3199449.1 DEAD/DEAH box helicase family protein [Clostridium botulinum C]MCD3204924.1 DEAD/DEAH box helicase family protein [Clostridium botulinum C]MCD3207749.1 DEAD/DEAH box helicase family protein [Clostridium botulinum C]MCD3224793.1 DEAD/DEAH box helicase family protein [Clostridium botulinum C]